MSEDHPKSPLTVERAEAAIRIVAAAVKAGEKALTYSELARRLGMSKVNGQGLNSYLIEAAAICAAHGWPNIGAFIVTLESLEAGQPMPAESALSEAFFAKTGLTRAEVPAEQARILAQDWSGLPDLEA